MEPDKGPCHILQLKRSIFVELLDPCERGFTRRRRASDTFQLDLQLLELAPHLQQFAERAGEMADHLAAKFPRLVQRDDGGLEVGEPPLRVADRPLHRAELSLEVLERLAEGIHALNGDLDSLLSQVTTFSA